MCSFPPSSEKHTQPSSLRPKHGNHTLGKHATDGRDSVSWHHPVSGVSLSVCLCQDQNRTSDLCRCERKLSKVMEPLTLFRTLFVQMPLTCHVPAARDISQCVVSTHAATVHLPDCAPVPGVPLSAPPDARILRHHVPPALLRGGLNRLQPVQCRHAVGYISASLAFHTPKPHSQCGPTTLVPAGCGCPSTASQMWEVAVPDVAFWQRACCDSLFVVLHDRAHAS